MPAGTETPAKSLGRDIFIYLRDQDTQAALDKITALKDESIAFSLLKILNNPETYSRLAKHLDIAGLERCKTALDSKIHELLTVMEQEASQNSPSNSVLPAASQSLNGVVAEIAQTS